MLIGENGSEQNKIPPYRAYILVGKTLNKWNQYRYSSISLYRKSKKRG